MAFKPLIVGALALAALSGCVEDSGSSSSYNKHVMLVNDSYKTVREFYGSNAGSDSWEEDILGSDELSPGQSVDVNFEDGSGYCSFDFKAVFTDGTSTVESGIDVCSTTTVTIN